MRYYTIFIYLLSFSRIKYSFISKSKRQNHFNKMTNNYSSATI